MLTLLFADRIENWPAYEPALKAVLSEAGIAAQILLPPVDPASVDYIIYSPLGPVQDFTAYTNTKAVMNLWAGVERVVGNATLTQPLCRMVDEGLERGMIEWVTGHVLRAHLDIDFFLTHQDGLWHHQGHVPPLARDRSVVILGIGALGGACATTLAGLGFNVTGWSRTQKALPGVTCLSGPEGLRDALSKAEILITVLPNTRETTDLLNAETLALMPKGAVILNPGRGNLIDDDALLAALDAGQIAHATLDVFRVEPLPPEHPYWAHPKVTVTPHIAAETRPASAARVIAENIRRFEAGEEPLHLVERGRGY
ncbi:glyoxylate/hydroxypyruvate reductase A [Rhodobacter aestuarii]|uniref:Glyoxylate/hydroxypyruvate reductase A n=1 Tax=Rhodobacter aestuarii TaxID=453582 RepID=A0A1N7KWV2_9RHOB|nr:glyoxylate/hydroxypyruvate reductase A [Rhodobacter aestuarii]PTV95524.1 glyoxylate/hydroxypyruvate reductase A [Rhodobacter aestuarii]SIS66075.1 glyoxylate/hydroxypyruvate reductase A [Rhodobacter aestuarii]